MKHGPHDRGGASPPGDALPRSGVDLSLSVDDVWLAEWAADGIERLERLLAAHAAFDVWRAVRQDVGNDSGDR